LTKIKNIDFFGEKANQNGPFQNNIELWDAPITN
jgi:hypothetical protein